uniref:Uncharacterized protein n=1 Tax=Tetranychus urticae TaxID=32264 RepID=T1JQA7_TETUR
MFFFKRGVHCLDELTISNQVLFT